MAKRKMFKIREARQEVSQDDVCLKVDGPVKFHGDNELEREWYPREYTTGGMKVVLGCRVAKVPEHDRSLMAIVVLELLSRRHADEGKLANRQALKARDERVKVAHLRLVQLQQAKQA
jgi:hypothetical protein